VSLRRRFALLLVLFALLVTAGGGWAAWELTSDALNREMDDKLRQVAGVAEAVGIRDAGFYLTLQELGSEDNAGWRTEHNVLRRLDEFVAGSWIFRTEDFRNIVSSLPPDELPMGTPLSELQLYRAQIAEADSTGTITTSPLHVGTDRAFYKYAFAGLRPSPSGVILAMRMRADYLRPLEVFRSRIVLVSGVAAIVALLLAGLLASTVAEPLERLSRAALRIQRGRWSEPVEVEPGSEIGRLSRAMERMRIGILSREEQLRLMLAQVAHEIRNPLGGLELFASAARDSDDSEERQRILERIREEVESLNVIINDFLSFARPMEPNTRIHDVRDPIREAAELVIMESRGDGVRVEMELPEEPVMASADPAHVKRITLNLIRNGAQAGEEVRVRSDLHRGEVRISVSDDGPGVPEELRKRIFEPFVSDKEQGAGLGLAIVRQIAESNGGRVELVDPEAKDHVGEGAEFRVYLKSSDEPPPSAEPSNQA